MSTDKIEKDETDDGRILPLEQMTIKHVYEDGLPLSESPLLECFFSPEGADPSAGYIFFGRGGGELHRHVVGGKCFTVELGGEPYQLTAHFEPIKQRVHGTWRPGRCGDESQADGGTYTAQAGGIPTAVSAYA
jgi:hypothetical protein